MTGPACGAPSRDTATPCDLPAADEHLHGHTGVTAEAVRVWWWHMHDRERPAP